MSQNIFDLKKKRGRKRKLQNSGDCSLSRSGSCDEPLQFDEKIENLNQDQETIETTLAMMIKTQEITTLTAHHEIIPEESPRSWTSAGCSSAKHLNEQANTCTMLYYYSSYSTIVAGSER